MHVPSNAGDFIDYNWNFVCTVWLELVKRRGL